MFAIPEIESMDYTSKELIKFMEHLKAAAARLVSSLISHFLHM